MKVAVCGIEERVKNYIAALRGVGLEPAVVRSGMDTTSFAGLVLPGGGDIDPALYGEENQGSEHIDRALDEEQLAMTDAFVRAGKPVLGICKGLQVLNVYFGGGIVQQLPAAGHHRRDGEDAVHPCFSVSDTDMARLYGRWYWVNSCHHQGLGRLGDGLSVTSAAEDGTVESAVHGSMPVFGVQWHPERMCFAKARPDTVDGAAVFRYFKSMLEKG